MLRSLLLELYKPEESESLENRALSGPNASICVHTVKTYKKHRQLRPRGGLWKRPRTSRTSKFPRVRAMKLYPCVPGRYPQGWWRCFIATLSLEMISFGVF
jgi:hypothetical protein